MTQTENQSPETATLTALSNELSSAVESIGDSVLTVDARRRLPATGIAWSADGYVVTANHIVERDDDLSVVFPDGTRSEATLIGRDASSDIALLSIPGSILTPVPRSASEPKPGHLAMAVGRPGRAGLSASLGIVSLVGGPWRTGKGSSIERYIRSDAAMLPGFSGGPLMDASGAALGMNSSTLGGRGGMTIPCEHIDPVIDALLSHGKVRRGYLGIGAQSLTLNNQLIESLDLDQDRGIVIVGLEPGGPAEQAGMLLGDIVVSIDGDPVATVENIQDFLTGDAVDGSVTLQYIRGGTLVNQDVEVAERR